MTGPASLCFRNRQKTKPLNLPLLRRIARTVLHFGLPLRPYELCVHFVGASEMSRLNEQYLQHIGPTDVITFSHAGEAITDRVASPIDSARPLLHGEIFICVDVAIEQARTFQTSWQSELARYLLHGLLHLHGYDDRDVPSRRRLKREEDRLLRSLASRFTLREIGACSKTRTAPRSTI